ncbi:hypothetical protein LV89_01180 [Arcicella aurantiaca]|uniref:Lipocalin-like protein n=1 Tax=Arcicella aurantiaca TaxID=591202 RepID=A0A316EEN4_9BACT|nr:hypothetical protein [Arcicella aurantiaca]PWK27773.1 hypothetical protein LV89_01180 [Arcicella aurantiaca]
MRKIFLYLPILFAFILVLSCGKTSTTEPTAAENLANKTWTVSIAKQNGTQVYQKGGTSNIEGGYSNYKLTLGTIANGSGTASLTARDGSTFSGTWALSGSDKVLTLSGLKNTAGAPPTGTSGTIVYNITSTVTATAVTLESAQPDLKAGNTTVNLQLVNP